jgi:hypothetical protein
MANNNITILSPSDAVISELFLAFEADGQPKARFWVPGLADILERNNEEFAKIVACDGYLFNRAAIEYRNITINLQTRSYINENGAVAPHPYYALVQINTNDSNRPASNDVIHVLATVNAFLIRNKLLPSRLEGQASQLFEPQIALLSAIQNAASGQIARTDEFFRGLVEKFDKRQDDLDELYTRKTIQLENGIEEKRSRLEADEARLHEKQRDLDDRDNTHVRRAIRGELIETIRNRQKTFSISRDTTRLRWPIHAVFLLLLLGTSAGAVWSLSTWASLAANKMEGWDPFLVTLAIKSIVFTFGFLTSAGLYISWMNRWFDKHAEAQFHTKQFEIDINRASWAVEAALEWKASQSEQMPDALLIGITKNLFDSQISDHANYAPLDALASSILGSASNLKLNVGGSELSFDRKGIKEIAKKDDLA